MSWGIAILLRLFAFAAGIFFIYCEAVGTYEFQLSQQLNREVDYIVLAGTGFAIALGLLPMYAGHAVRNRQWGIAVACWLAVPIVMTVVYYAAIQRTGGGADQLEAERLRQSRAGTLAAKTEQDATTTWETARDAAKVECASGRGRKCVEAEGKRDHAWGEVTKAREELKHTPETRPASGESRAVAILPFLTEGQVRLYQPMLIPVGISILAAVFMSISVLLHTPPMPRPWQRWRNWLNWPSPSRPAGVIDLEPIEPAKEAPSFKMQAPQRPKLVASSSEGAGSIPKILHAMLEPAVGSNVEAQECHAGYAAQCLAEGKRAVPPVQFVDPLVQFCGRAGIRTKAVGARFYLLDVELAMPHRRMPLGSKAAKRQPADPA
jgi:hypothetical protein